MTSLRICTIPLIRRIASTSRPSSYTPIFTKQHSLILSSPNICRKLSSSVSGKNEEKAKEDTSVKGKFSTFFKKYGYIFVGTYLGVYVTTLGSLFVALDFDIFNASTFGFDPEAAVRKVCDIVESTTGSTSMPGYIRENPRVGTFAIAWVITKFTEPLRFGGTVMAVPLIARFLGRKEVPDEKK